MCIYYIYGTDALRALVQNRRILSLMRIAVPETINITRRVGVLRERAIGHSIYGIVII